MHNSNRNCKIKSTDFIFKRLDSKVRPLAKDPAEKDDSSNGKGWPDFVREGNRVENDKEGEKKRTRKKRNSKRPASSGLGSGEV